MIWQSFYCKWTQLNDMPVILSQAGTIPHALCIEFENKDLGIWYELSKAIWGYSLQATIEKKLNPQPFSIDSVFDTVLTQGRVTLNGDLLCHVSDFNRAVKNE